MEAIILAGGMGTRLRSVVADVPKCMAPVGGRPLLYYILYILENAGFSHVILSLGYKHKVVEKYVKTYHTQMEISCVVEDEPLGTGGAVKLALAKAREEDVFVLNGDTYFIVNYKKMMKEHLKKDARATLALKKMTDFSRYGRVEMDTKGRIRCFHEKEHCPSGLINGGVYLMKKDALDAMPEKFSLEKDFFEKEVPSGKLAGVAFNGYFIDIGIPEDYEKAQKDFTKKEVKGYNTLFLDRDGVINRQVEGGYVKNWKEFFFLKGVLQCAGILSGWFDHIIVITNQRGVGKGIMTDEDVTNIHVRMMETFLWHNCLIDEVYYCPSVDDEDPYRKPNIGMALRSKKDFPDIDFADSFYVGDSLTDVEFANKAGIPAILVGNKYNAETISRLNIHGHYKDLPTFAAELQKKDRI